MPIALLVLLYRRAPDAYRYWCSVFVGILGLALLCFWLYPLMPPRLLPTHLGFVDTADHYFNVTREPLRHALGNTSTPSPGSWAANNPYAAMPSLHVSWALWALLARWSVVRSRAARVLLVVYAPLMVLAVLVTGNHWMVDVIGAAAVLAASIALTSAVQATARRAARAKLGRELLPGELEPGSRELEPVVQVV